LGESVDGSVGGVSGGNRGGGVGGMVGWGVRGGGRVLGGGGGVEGRRDGGAVGLGQINKKGAYNKIEGNWDHTNPTASNLGLTVSKGGSKIEWDVGVIC